MAILKMLRLDKNLRRYIALVELNNDDEILMAQVSMEELNTLRPTNIRESPKFSEETENE